MRTETTFELNVRAPYQEAATLFSPLGERVWAGPAWNPQFLHPLPPIDEQGAVFNIVREGYTATWVISRRDLDARCFQYVYFIPGLLVTTIDVFFTLRAADCTGVQVRYVRTAISAQGEAQVQELAAVDAAAAAEWQSAIDRYLASRHLQAAADQG